MLKDIAYAVQLVLEAAVGLVGIRAYEEPRYVVVATPAPDVEIRRYEPRIAARVEMSGRGEEARDEAFRTLFRYIAGANAGAEKVAMTMPVDTGARGEKIAMTVPVDTAEGERMDFFLPASLSLETAPKPTDPRVTLVPVPEETVATLRFTGLVDESEREKRIAELLAALTATPWRASAKPSILFYDSPLTLPFLRRNEASVRVVGG